MRFLAVLILLALLMLLPAPALPQQAESVRVALLRDVQSVSIDGAGVLFVDDKKKPLPFSVPLAVKRENGALVAAGRRLGGIAASAGDYVLINGKRYRGVVELSSRNQGILVVNEIPLEDYLVGLINCEISSLWPMEAIKAQAVVARTYALFQKKARQGLPYHLESSVLDQVYQGCELEDSRSARGVRETAGEVLTYNGILIQAFYHSMCGGHTEAAENVWGYPIPYLNGTECTFCLTTPTLNWEQKIPLAKIESLLKEAGFGVAGLAAVKIDKRNRSGRNEEVVLIPKKGKPVRVSAPRFRKAVGFGVIRSTKFTVDTFGGVATFSGIGNGHGVGLCQWGARNQALQGATYREILSHYYPGTAIQTQ